MLGNLLYQSRKPDETIVLHSGYEPGTTLRLQENFPWVDMWVERPDFQDFGHDKRAHGIELATKDFLGFFNDDDTYDREYVEKMLAACATGDVAYCKWNLGDVQFSLGSSTSGNFIVHTELAKSVGYHGRDYSADGQFINAVRERANGIIYVQEDLYRWNALERT